MKISNIKNKYLRRLAFWLSLPVAFLILAIIQGFSTTVAAFEGAVSDVRQHYAAYWAGTYRKIWEQRKFH